MPGNHGFPTPSWWGASAPVTRVTIASPTYIGMGFQFTAPGRIFGFRLYNDAGAFIAPWGVLWNDTAGPLLSVKNFAISSSPGGWRNAWIHPTVRVNTSDFYRLMILATSSYYRTNTRFSGGPITTNNIKMAGGLITTLINPTIGAPTSNTNAYGVDVLFKAD